MILASTAERRDNAIAYARKAIGCLELFLSLEGSGGPVSMAGFLRAGNRCEAEHVGAALIYANVALASVNMHRYSDGARYARRSVEILRPIPSASNLIAQSSAFWPMRSVIRET